MLVLTQDLLLSGVTVYLCQSCARYAVLLPAQSLLPASMTAVKRHQN